MLIHGATSGNVIVPLLLSASGETIISANQLTTTGGKIKLDSSGRVIVDADSPSYFAPSVGVARFDNLSLPAGNSTQLIATVPAGQIWRVKVFGVYYGGTVAGVSLYLVLFIGGVQATIGTVITPVTTMLNDFHPDSLISGGDRIECVVQGATLNDDFIGIVTYDRYR